MGVLGAYSNPEIQERLRRLAEKLDRLAASDAVPRASTRMERQLRGGLVPNAIMRVLRDPAEPMRARDIHACVERLLCRPVSRSSIKNALARHARGDGTPLVRQSRGLYLASPN
jgi:hypothetical protein